MISDVLGFLDYSVCAEIALVLFVSAFAFVTMRVVLMRQEESDGLARIPVDDGAGRKPHG